MDTLQEARKALEAARDARDEAFRAVDVVRMALYAADAVLEAARLEVRRTAARVAQLEAAEARQVRQELRAVDAERAVWAAARDAAAWTEERQAARDAAEAQAAE